MRDESDHVTGFAILSEFEEGKQYLTILCRSDKTRVMDTLTIPVAEKGAAHKHERPKDGPWRYEIDRNLQGVMNVSPSVRWCGPNEKADLFHNLGQWSVKFVYARQLGDICKLINKANIDEVANHWRLYPKKG